MTERGKLLFIGVQIFNTVDRNVCLSVTVRIINSSTYFIIYSSPDGSRVSLFPESSVSSVNPVGNNSNNENKEHHRSAHRRFYTMPQKPEMDPLESITHAPVGPHRPFGCSDFAENNAAESLDLISYINENIIGRNKIFRGPFGDRQSEFLYFQ